MKTNLNLLRVLFVLTWFCAAPAFAGIKLSNNTVNFGEVQLFTLSTKDFTITNTFNAKITVTMTPTGGFFKINRPDPFDLDPNQTATVTLTVGAQLPLGSRSGSIQISGNGVTKTLTVKAKVFDPFETKIEPAKPDFGSVTVGSSKELNISIKNKTKETLVYKFATDPPFNTNVLTLSVASGQAANLKVTFTPTAGKPAVSTLSIQATNVAGRTGAIGKLPISGIGVVSNVVNLNPTLLDFGDVDRGSGKQLSFTVTNPEADSRDFEVTRTGNFVVSTTPFVLQGGQQKVITVNVEAGVPPGNMTGSVTVTRASATGTVNLTAKVFDPFGTELNPQSLDFGSVNTGQTKPLPFTVKNTSPGTLTYTTTSNPSLYSGSPASLNLSPGQTGTFTITFNPGSNKGSLGGNIDVRANNTVVGSVTATANVP